MNIYFQVFASKRELILHNEKAGCKSVLCDNCNKRFASSSTLRAHFCLLKKENIDTDAEGVIEIQVNAETPGFQVKYIIQIVLLLSNFLNGFIIIHNF